MMTDHNDNKIDLDGRGGGGLSPVDMARGRPS